MKHHALIVDDETTILTTLGAILEDHGFQVDCAASANEAAQKIAEISECDLVITDLNMETELAGYEVVKAARALLHPPITILLSAYIGDSDWAECGANAAFSKPAQVSALLQTIDTLIQERDQHLSSIEFPKLVA